MNLCNLCPHTDEGALVKAARELGVVFKARTPDSIIIEVVGTCICIHVHRGL